MKTSAITRRLLRALPLAALAVLSSAGLSSCIGFDAALDPTGGSYWSVDDYIGAPGYWGPGFYGNGWGAPPPPPPAFGPSVPVPGPAPVRPPQNNRPSTPPSPAPGGGNQGGGGNYVPSGSTTPAFPTNPSGGTRPGNNGRPR